MRIDSTICSPNYKNIGYPKSITIDEDMYSLTIAFVCKPIASVLLTIFVMHMSLTMPFSISQFTLKIVFILEALANIEGYE